MRLGRFHECAARARAARGGRHEEVVQHEGAVGEDRAERGVELREADELAGCVLGDEDHRFVAPEALVEIAAREREIRRHLVELAVGVEERRDRVEIACSAGRVFTFVFAIVSFLFARSGAVRQHLVQQLEARALVVTVRAIETRAPSLPRPSCSETFVHPRRTNSASASLQQLIAQALAPRGWQHEELVDLGSEAEVLETEDVDGEQVTDRLAAREAIQPLASFGSAQSALKLAPDAGRVETRDVLEQPILLDERQQRRESPSP